MMIRVSREVIVVADLSTFARRRLSVITKLDGVHKVLTDDRVSPVEPTSKIVTTLGWLRALAARA